MKTICLKLLLSIALIFTVVRASFVNDAIITDKDVGNCTSASDEDLLPFYVMEPKSYNIQFTVGFNFPHALSKILIQIYQQTKTIRLHAHKIRIKLSQIQLMKEAKNTKIHVPVGYRYCKISQMLDLYFEDAILPAFYYLKLNFTVPITIYLHKNSTQYTAISLAKHERWFSTNLLETIAPRRMFPCWDEPGVRAIFNISVIHPKKYRILSNMPARMNSSISDEFMWTHFMPSSLIAASEVAIVVTDNNIIRHFDAMMDSVWCYPESVKNLSLAVSTIVEVRISLSKYTELSTMPRTQHIMIPSSLKIIGTPGLIIYRERDVSYLERSDFIGVKISVAQLIASQIIRQWFRRDVIQSTSLWFDWWISQSFATYFSYFFSFQVDISTQLEELFVVQILQPALHSDIALRMNYIAHAVCDIIHGNEIDRVLYSRFYHKKEAVFLRMLQEILSPQKFKERVGQYLTKPANDSIPGNDLWETLQGIDDIQQKGNPHIKDVMYGWLRQKHYPELYITYETNNFSITTFCESHTNCHIPINILVQSDDNCCGQITLPLMWMQCNESKVIFKPRNYIFIFNLRQVGYYRVNYANRNWRKISDYLQYGDYTNIPVQNRAQLIDDAYYFTMAGKLSPSIFLDLIGYLKHETHYVAWYPMFNILTYMSAYWKLPASRCIKPNILEILDNLLKNIGYEERLEDDGMTKSLRLLAAKWSCKLGHNECRKAASAKLQAKYNSPDTQILPWWKEWMYCTGMMKLNERTWQHILRESLRSSDISTLKYLACTSNATRITYYISFLNSKEMAELMGNEQLTEHFHSTLKRHIWKDIVYQYVLARFMEIIDKFYKNKLIVLWGDIIWNLRSEDQWAEIVKFSYKVKTNYSPGQDEISKMISARKNELRKIQRMFSHF